MIHVPASAFANPPDMVPDATDFLRDVVHSDFGRSEQDPGRKGKLSQHVDHGYGEQGSDASPFLVSRPLQFDALPVPAARPVQPARKARAPKIGRPRKPGPKPATPLDGRRRKAEGPLTAKQRLDILDAVAFARDEGSAMDTTIDMHPGLLDTYPEGVLRDWFRSGPWRQAGQWLERHGVEWTAFATSENYEGDRRQHFHMVCRCPACLRPGLESTLRQCFPGEPQSIKVGVLKKDGVTYRIKQSLGNATGQPRPGRPTPERVSRWDGAPVAAVMGKRYFLSRNVSRSAREADGWQQQRDEDRAVERVRRKAMAARLDAAVVPIGATVAPLEII